eukprot:Colp12_sorted_trinity150504_noHs@7163
MSNTTLALPPMWDTGNTGFMLVASSLVMLMTPGLAFFYGGLVGQRATLTIIFQSFVSLAITDVVWFICGYSLAFSGNEGGGFIGNLDRAFMMGLGLETPYANNPTIPELVFFIYQMMFATITPALITGAWTNRIHFKAYIIFLVLWQLLVYIPWVHWVWGGGFLAEWGVLDFAGGIVVHVTAGMAALAAVFFVGPRYNTLETPHSLPMVAIGTGLLWFGWYGFNAGSELAVDSVTVLAFVNTDISAATAACTWMLLEWFLGKQPKFLGFLTGAIAGLATVTPAAGYITTWAAFVIGIIAAFVCYGAVMFKNYMKWDDALDVWGVHGVGGIAGSILLGCFATKSINPKGADGLFYGGGAFFGKQVCAVVFAGVHSFIFTYGMLWLLDKVTPVVLSEAEQHALDDAMLGEAAYDMFHNLPPTHH